MATDIDPDLDEDGWLPTERWNARFWAIASVPPLMVAFAAWEFNLDGIPQAFGAGVAFAVLGVLAALLVVFALWYLAQSFPRAIRPAADGLGVRSLLLQTEMTVPWAEVSLRDVPSRGYGIAAFGNPVYAARLLSPGQYAAVKVAKGRSLATGSPLSLGASGSAG